jgi:hypothetical protein
MQAEAERLGRLLWHDSGPLLGPAARYSAARRACVSCADRVADLAQLPAVLRAAAEIDIRVDAASFFANSAVLLPANSPLTLAETAGDDPVSSRQSGRSPYEDVLEALNACPVIRRVIDLIPSQAWAERLLVRLILRVEDLTRRQTAILPAEGDVAAGDLDQARIRDRPEGGEPSDGGRNAPTDFKGSKRSNETHRSATDPDARLYRKGRGMEAKLCFIGHGLIENRSGLIVDARLTRVSGHAERLTALDMIQHRADRSRDHARRRQGLRRGRLRREAPHVERPPAHGQNTSRRR